MGRTFQVEPEQSSETVREALSGSLVAVVDLESPSSQGTCYKHTAGEDQNQYVRMASKISNNDLDFLALLDAENGMWTPDRVGVTNDIGFCQISPYWHPNIVNDPSFYDPYWQITKCYELYTGGTTFYGAQNIWKTKPNFTCNG